MYKVIVCDDEKEILNSIQISVKESLENNEVNAEYECIDDARILMKTLKEQKIFFAKLNKLRKSFVMCIPCS